MVDYRRSEIVSGLFIAAAIATFGLFAFRVGGFDLGGVLRGRTLALRASFPDVKTLTEGAKVTVAGRRVGKVTKLELIVQPLDETAAQDLAQNLGLQPGTIRAGMHRQMVEVTFELDDPSLRVEPSSARVALVQDGFLGTHFLELSPGYWPPQNEPATIFAAAIEPGRRIRVRRSAGLDDLIAMLRPVVRELEGTLLALREGVLAPANVESLGRTLSSVEQAVKTASSTIVTLRDRLTQGTLAKVDDLLDQGHTTMTAAQGVLQTTQTLLGAESGSVRKVVRDLADATDSLRQRLDALQGDVHVLLGTTNGMLADNRAQIDEILRRLRRTSWQAEMAVRKVRANPAFLLFGDEEPDLESKDLDESGLRRSGRAQPYAQRDEGDAGKK